MRINWSVRLKNKSFWLAIIPALLLVAQAIASALGYQLELGDIGNKLIAVVNAVFTALCILGIVTDPTTKGLGDSARALGYSKLGR